MPTSQQHFFSKKVNFFKMYSPLNESYLFNFYPGKII